MPTTSSPRRLPASIRKHLRTKKAELRRTLAPEEAERAISQLVRRFRQGAGNPPAKPAPKP